MALVVRVEIKISEACIAGAKHEKTVYRACMHVSVVMLVVELYNT